MARSGSRGSSARKGCAPKAPRRFRVTTDSKHGHPIAPNVLDRQFAVEDGAALDRVWIGDTTYLTTREGWLYLAIVLDLASRRVIGWAMRHTLEGALTRDVLLMALTGRQPAPGTLYHSDKGSQYAAGDYQDILIAHAIAHAMACSMSRRGNCWDNAVAESFFATLKRELADDADWATRDDARTAVSEYIEVWYNQQRRHSSLGYLSPAAFELQQARMRELTNPVSTKSGAAQRPSRVTDGGRRRSGSRREQSIRVCLNQGPRRASSLWAITVPETETVASRAA